MANAIHGQLDGIAGDAAGLQDVSDEQNAIMQRLGSICDGLAPTLQGAAGVAMQQAGERMHTTGTQIATMFADHSQKMTNNAQMMDGKDQENSHLLSGIANL
jgi:WXG100 family type VII secretion target